MVAPHQPLQLRAPYHRQEMLHVNKNDIAEPTQLSAAERRGQNPQLLLWGQIHKFLLLLAAGYVCAQDAGGGMSPAGAAGAPRSPCVQGCACGAWSQRRRECEQGFCSSRAEDTLFKRELRHQPGRKQVHTTSQGEDTGCF